MFELQLTVHFINLLFCNNSFLLSEIKTDLSNFKYNWQVTLFYPIFSFFSVFVTLKTVHTALSDILNINLTFGEWIWYFFLKEMSKNR